MCVCTTYQRISAARRRHQVGMRRLGIAALFSAAKAPSVAGSHPVLAVVAACNSLQQGFVSHKHMHLKESDIHEGETKDPAQ